MPFLYHYLTGLLTLVGVDRCVECCIIILTGLGSQMCVLYHFLTGTDDYTRRSRIYVLYHYFNRAANITGKSQMCVLHHFLTGLPTNKEKSDVCVCCIIILT